ncbi:hypothetical protein OH76DRAFT_1487780 [Lentinus brumalis]|uniref:F-box domain-containing protein n=1 Tax=Lentinus brumalis TaxID=2498619 RepID=A0A371CTB4_9APHY|nr:hypothetical protein OH76DRAFT_1487780 [Polyporus brumalis]
MSLFSLNDDVLLAIFANLHGEDALNVSLTSKRAYRLAGPRIAARINCSSPAELRRLHTYLLSDLPDDTPRARSLEHLVIDTSTFEAAENDDDSSYYGDDFSQAKLIGDILLQARNLRELSFERFPPCLERDPRIGDAIRSLTSLVNMRLFTISDSSLSVFDSFMSDQLARLTLSYYVSDEFPLEYQTKTLPPLISILSALHRLRIVKLWNFDPTAGLAREALSSLPLLLSIRYLRLSDTSIPALDMVELCPALSTLIVSFSWEAEMMPVSEGPKWPPLRRLMVAELGDALRFSKRLRTVDQLQISGLLRLWDSPGFSEYGPAQQPLLELLRSTSPVSLFICVETTCQEEDLWGELPRAAPRLRSLELQLEGLVPSKLPAALSGLSLVCLRVLVPEQKQRRWKMGFASKEEGLAKIRQQEVDRVKALAALPDPLVRALPSLRYLAVGDMAPNMQLLGEGADVDASVAALRVKDEEVVWEWDELRRLSAVRKQCWWRIVDGPIGRQLVEISEYEGEEAQWQIESVTEDTTHIEEGLASLSV